MDLDRHGGWIEIEYKFERPCRGYVNRTLVPIIY